MTFRFSHRLVATWMYRFFLACAAASIILVVICLLTSLPKELVILSVHASILSLVGVFINSWALSKFKEIDGTKTRLRQDFLSLAKETENHKEN
jgi:hypothetical protein